MISCMDKSHLLPRSVNEFTKNTCEKVVIQLIDMYNPCGLQAYFLIVYLNILLLFPCKVSSGNVSHMGWSMSTA